MLALQGAFSRRRVDTTSPDANMSSKRRLEDSSDPAPKKQRKGFQVGPANLPDGTWKRKNQRIKRDLIERAQIKKSYAKLREHSKAETSTTTDVSDQLLNPTAPEPASLELHPARQELVDAAARTDDPGEGDRDWSRESRRRERRGKSNPFEREVRVAEKKRAEAETRDRAREERQREREKRLEERERHRKAMAKARTGGKNGQRKLGRESKVLLDKVKRLMKSE